MRCNIPERDLAQKLDATVCRYKKDPVYVRVDGRSLILYKLPDTSTRYQIIRSTDPEFDVAGVPLGYMLYSQNQTVYYLSRLPARRVKQGLDARTVRIRNIAGSTNVGVNAQSLLFSQGFVDLINNKFLPLSDALKMLRGKFKSNSESTYEVPIRRDIALGIDKQGIIKVFYKTDYVGWIAPDQHTVNVKTDDFSWVVSRYLSQELDWKVA